MKTAIFKINSVELLTESEILKEFEAEAAISLNPNVTWMKFVLTDSRPNLNRQRVPTEEFSNVIKTGMFMPIKMAQGKISEGHADTVPLGVMTHLLEQDNEVVALAALWDREREADVAYLRERFKEDKPIDVSWELSYTDSEYTDEGVEVFAGVTMNAATIVGMPAYMGRTNVEEIAAQEDLEQENTNMDTINIDKHEELMGAQADKLKGEIDELETQLGDTQTELTELQESSESDAEELVTLQEFKTSVEAQEERAAWLIDVRQQFEESGLEVTDEYFDEREDTFAEMSPEQVEFFIQELVAFEDATEEEDPESEASVNLTGKTPITRSKKKDEDVDLLAYLKSLDEKE